MCPSRAGLGVLKAHMSVSLVPRLKTMSPSSTLMPAKEAGLSPVNATTLQSGLNPYCCTRYGDIDPISSKDGTRSPSFSFRLGAHAWKWKVNTVEIQILISEPLFFQNSR